MSLRCNACKREWNEPLLPEGGMEAQAFAKRLRSVTCPRCGADHTHIDIAFGGAHNPKAPPRELRALDLGAQPERTTR